MGCFHPQLFYVLFSHNIFLKRLTLSAFQLMVTARQDSHGTISSICTESQTHRLPALRTPTLRWFRVEMPHWRVLSCIFITWVSPLFDCWWALKERRGMKGHPMSLSEGGVYKPKTTNPTHSVFKSASHRRCRRQLHTLKCFSLTDDSNTSNELSVSSITLLALNIPSSSIFLSFTLSASFPFLNIQHFSSVFSLSASPSFCVCVIRCETQPPMSIKSPWSWNASHLNIQIGLHFHCWIR